MNLMLLKMYDLYPFFPAEFCSIVTLLAIPEMQQIPLRVCLLNILAN